MLCKLCRKCCPNKSEDVDELETKHDTNDVDISTQYLETDAKWVSTWLRIGIYL